MDSHVAEVCLGNDRNFTNEDEQHYGLDIWNFEARGRRSSDIVFSNDQVEQR